MTQVMDKALKATSLTRQKQPCKILIGDVVRSRRSFIKSFDVAIVGSGPAGSYLGYCLAKAGVECVILDSSDPQDNTSCAKVSFRALKKFPVLQAVSGPKNISGMLHLISPSGSEVVIDNDQSGAKIINLSRANLDTFLLQAAVRRGTYHYKEDVKSIQAERGGWILHTNTQNIRARLIIGADGASSSVRTAVSTPLDQQNIAHTMGFILQGNPRPNSVIKWLRNSDGHMWIHNSDKVTSVGITDRLSNKSEMIYQINQFLATECTGAKVLSQWTHNSPRLRSVGALLEPCAGKNWLLIGDTAGHVNPITGEEVLYALWSAELASQAIIAGDTRLFDQLWREEYGTELFAAIKHSNLFHKTAVLEQSVRLARKSATFSHLLFDILAGQTKAQNMPMQACKALPRSVVEMLF